MMDDELNCRLRRLAGRAVNPSLSLKLSMVGKAKAAVFSGDDFGDIREYFPPPNPQVDGQSRGLDRAVLADQGEVALPKFLSDD